MIHIFPSTSPQQELSKVQDLLDRAVGIERVHIDFVDGVFADNTTVEPQVIASLTTNSKLDFHLMVDKPVEWLQKCKEGGADRVISQIEMMFDIDAYVDVSKDMFGMVGLALDLDSEVEKIPEHLLQHLDTLLLMSVKAGFGGQEFESSALEKIKYFDKVRKKNGYLYTIGVDGGVSLENIKSIVDAGVDEVSVGNRLFEGDLAGNINRYLKAAYNK